MEDFYLQISLWFEQNSGTALALVAGFLGVAVFYIIYLHIRISRVATRFKHLLRDVNGQNLEELLLTQELQLRETLQEMARVKMEQAQFREGLDARAFPPQVLRYSAFEDTGSDQSFSLALLDSHANGAVVTTLHGRGESRTYAKPIVNGQSRYILTEEESQAVAAAVRQIGSPKEELSMDGRKQPK